MKFIYHVCARKNTIFFDGIIEKDKPVLSYAEYHGIKESLAKQKIFVGANPEEITITSLSLLHELDK